MLVGRRREWERAGWSEDEVGGGVGWGGEGVKGGVVIFSRHDHVLILELRLGSGGGGGGGDSSPPPPPPHEQERKQYESGWEASEPGKG